MFLYFCVIEHINSRKGLCGLLNEQKGLEWNVLRTRVLDCGRVKQRDCGAASRGSALKCVSLQKGTKKLEVQEADEVTVHVTQWLLERGRHLVLWSPKRHSNYNNIKHRSQFLGWDCFASLTHFQWESTWTHRNFPLVLVSIVFGSLGGCFVLKLGDVTQLNVLKIPPLF